MDFTLIVKRGTGQMTSLFPLSNETGLQGLEIVRKQLGLPNLPHGIVLSEVKGNYVKQIKLSLDENQAIEWGGYENVTSQTFEIPTTEAVETIIEEFFYRKTFCRKEDDGKVVSAWLSWDCDKEGIFTECLRIREAFLNGEAS